MPGPSQTVLLALDRKLTTLLERRYGPWERWRLSKTIISYQERRAERSRWYSPHPWHVRMWRRLPVAVQYVVAENARKLDRGLRLVFEAAFGPMEQWRLYRYL